MISRMDFGIVVFFCFVNFNLSKLDIYFKNDGFTLVENTGDRLSFFLTTFLSSRLLVAVKLGVPKWRRCRNFLCEKG